MDCLLQNQDSVLIDGTCQIPDPLYKLVGSIVCFYIPLGVMLLTYALTVRLLAMQQRGLCTGAAGVGSAAASSGWPASSSASANQTTSLDGEFPFVRRPLSDIFSCLFEKMLSVYQFKPR